VTETATTLPAAARAAIEYIGAARVLGEADAYGTYAIKDPYTHEDYTGAAAFTHKYRGWVCARAIGLSDTYYALAEAAATDLEGLRAHCIAQLPAEIARLQALLAERRAAGESALLIAAADGALKRATALAAQIARHR
jgi:hypothetical protein